MITKQEKNKLVAAAKEMFSLRWQRLGTQSATGAKEAVPQPCRRYAARGIFRLAPGACAPGSQRAAAGRLFRSCFGDFIPLLEPFSGCDTVSKARFLCLPWSTAEAVPFHRISRIRLLPLSMALAAIFFLSLGVISASAQTSGNSSLGGVVADPTGAVVPGATVEIHNPVSQFARSTTTDGAGRFNFPNVPFNLYHLNVSVTGFAPYSQDVDVRSAVPLSLKITLQIAGTAESVTVQGEASDLLENDPTFHTDVDRSL